MGDTARPAWMLPPIETLTELPIERIALQLSRLNRYAGSVQWSVCQHSLLVRHLCRDCDAKTQLWALLHDAHECWTGDIRKPVKDRLRASFDVIEHDYDWHIWRMIGFIPDSGVCKLVDKADKEACRLEMKYLQAYGGLCEYRGFTTNNSEREFLEMYETLKGKI